MNRLPDPGSPAHVAHTDQYDAACAHARVLFRQMVTEGITPVAASGPWARGMLDAATRGSRHACVHLRADRGPRPWISIVPATLFCTDCAAKAVADPSRPGVCGKCGQLAALRELLAGEDHTIVRGRLCWPCLIAEQAANRGRR